ncbi:ATP-binding protein [Phenylobacterium deserti]|uniref:histidine kinase n=1 Tax=Phenylobacterium deserti TaxID=1914756 RepID=A0A328ASP7_9CAUL|nr:ATP-binding protein [Phenylobacterium deserti]RAK58010.1 hybrid sensor histidine kinase/response regulator [Phenylobacterium deserti]
MRRSLGLFAISSLLPLVILGAGVGTVSLRNQRVAIEHQAQDQAKFAATLIGRELVSDMRRVQMIAQSPALDGGFDRERFQRLASRLIADEPLWRTISVANPGGERLFDVPRPIGGRAGGKVIDPESLHRAVTLARPTVGRIMIGPRGTYAFAVRAPVVRDGSVPFIVSAVVNPTVVGEVLASGGLPRGWSAEVIDDVGNVVARVGPAAAKVGHKADLRSLASRTEAPAFYRFEGADGAAQVATFRPISGTNWTVHVLMPATAYNAPVVRAVSLLTVAVLLSLVLSGVLAVLLARELRQHRTREEAALEGHRMEALGRMTGGVAHDFNNLLTPIIGGMDMLQRRLVDDPKALRIVEGALASAERAKTLVARLLAFARRQTLEPRDVDVADLLGGLTDLLERSVGPNVRVEFEAAPDLPAARVDPAQLELAVLNLAVNARDAMPSGGALRISADQRLADPKTDGLPEGRYVRIAVSDTGQGMDPVTLQRAIEPFFTTKGIGKGTGLGLSMVHGLAAQSGGTLKLYSVPETGTTAEIWLPASPTRPAPQREAEAVRDLRTGRLLLVDDDELVRTSTAELLREHGHIVSEASSASEALKLLRADPQIDVLVTDYAMPGRTGGELLREARLLRPDLPALLITGYAGAAEDVPADVDRLGKPFRRAELLNRVAALLPTVQPAQADSA